MWICSFSFKARLQLEGIRDARDIIDGVNTTYHDGEISSAIVVNYLRMSNEVLKCEIAFNKRRHCVAEIKTKKQGKWRIV